jgi:lysophospholipase L1-like esterase
LSTAIQERNLFSLLAKKYLAQVYERTERLAEARDALRVRKNVAAPMHGGLPIYLDTEYQSIMREVAIEYGIKLVEASQELDKDPSVYLDNCHPNEVGHAIIARLLYEAVKDILNTQKSAGF